MSSQQTFIHTYLKMESLNKVANSLEVSLFEIEDELKLIHLNKDSKRNALRVGKLRTRCRSLFQEFLTSVYTQSKQGGEELKKFEERLHYIKKLISQNGFQLS